MENFTAYVDCIVDLDFVQLSRFYVDIAKGTCPSSHLLAL